MKLQTLIFQIIFSVLVLASDAKSCPNISGMYIVPTNDPEITITVIYQKNECTSLFINGYKISNVPPYSTNYHGVSVPFRDDQTIPQELAHARMVEGEVTVDPIIYKKTDD